MAQLPLVWHARGAVLQRSRYAAPVGKQLCQNIGEAANYKLKPPLSGARWGGELTASPQPPQRAGYETPAPGSCKKARCEAAAKRAEEA